MFASFCSAPAKDCRSSLMVLPHPEATASAPSKVPKGRFGRQAGLAMVEKFTGF